MSLFDTLGAGPWVIFSALGTWLASLWHHQSKAKRAELERDDRLEIHRDELTLNLLQSARGEMDQARAEAVHLREEVRTLRSMEDHFFRFQQALDHLEALLFYDTSEEREIAERNARAFLARMRKLKEDQKNAS